MNIANTIIDDKDEILCIPQNFDSKEILVQEGWKPFMINNHHQKLDFMVHQVFINRVCNNKYEKGDFIYLSTEHHFRRYLYGREYNNLKPLLYKYKIIEDDGTYTVASEENGFNGKCLGYRLTKKYDVQHKRVLVSRDSTLFNNIKRFRAMDYAAQDDVTKWINQNIKKLTIDKEAAIAFVDHWYADALKNPASVKLKKGQRKKPFSKVVEGKKERYLHAINSIAEGTAFNAIRDNKGKRVHHPISNLWRKLRPFIYIKSAPATEIYNLDISNSQPFCLNKILIDTFPDGNYPADVKKYMDLTLNGSLYNYLIDLLNVPEPDHQDFKIQLFANVFYGENQKSFYTKDAQAFFKEFPTVYEVIMKEKQQAFNSLAIAMQAIESKAIIDGVMTDLMYKYQDQYFFSCIHDSILCEKHLVEEVRELMETHLMAVVGIKPKIKQAELFNKVF